MAKTVTFDDLATRLVGDKWCAHSGMWLRSSLPTPEALDDDSVTTKQTPAPVADGVRSFFAEHDVASMRLPSGWFGRPHDNWHQLTEATPDGGEVLVRFDETQVLTLRADDVSSEGLVLRVNIQGGSWRWTEYGGDRQHTEILGPGTVEFHAPGS